MREKIVLVERTVVTTVDIKNAVIMLLSVPSKRLSDLATSTMPAIPVTVEMTLL
jgi:hypothetical protein